MLRAGLFSGIYIVIFETPLVKEYTDIAVHLCAYIAVGSVLFVDFVVTFTGFITMCF